MAEDDLQPEDATQPKTAFASVLRLGRFEQTWLTFVFWGAVALLASAFLACPYPPMIDYPQHVAMGSLLHDLWAGEAYAQALYRTTLFTYNAGIETSIALLSFLMNPELAGRVVLAAHVVVFATAALALCNYTRRPRWYALLAVPIVHNHITGWGFSNFVVALPLAVIAAVMWMRVVDGDRSRWRLALIIAFSMVVAFTHVLVMLCLCVIVAVVTLEIVLKRDGEGVWDRGIRLLTPGVVLVPAVAYSLGAWFWARATSTTVWEHSWAEGQGRSTVEQAEARPVQRDRQLCGWSGSVLGGDGFRIGGRALVWCSGCEGRPTDPTYRLGIFRPVCGDPEGVHRDFSHLPAVLAVGGALCDRCDSACA